MANRPNIVLIFSDQHRGDTMGCVGHSVVRTPNLDSLASAGVVFRQCSTNSPLCMPARASLITGQHVNQHGVWDNRTVADRSGPSHVRNVRDAGYRTAVVGKTHLYLHQGSEHTDDHVQELHDWGYEDIHEVTGPLASARVNSPYTDYLEEKRLLNVHRESLRVYLRGLARGYGHPWEESPCLLPTEDHIDVYTARKAAEWIEGYQDDRPFYLQVCFPGPHDPFDSPAEYRAMYNPDNVPPGIMDVPEPPISPLVSQLLGMSHLGDMGEIQNRVMRSYYFGKVTLVDDGIGQVVQALEKAGRLGDTWIIYSSDHGEMLGDHRLNHKMVFYEGALRIPCIVRPPGGMAGWQSDALTDQIDTAASILDIAGAAPLTVGGGRSLVPQVIAGPAAEGAQIGKEAVFSEVFGVSMVRTERYKMSVDARTRQPVDLYDMSEDPNELHNRVDDPALARVRRELLEQHLSRLLSSMDETKLTAHAEDLGRMFGPGPA